MINPWLIYLMSCANGLLILSSLLLIISSTWVLVALETDGKLSKYGIILSIICILIILLVPSEKTILAMIAASSITPDNLPTDMYTYVKELYETCGHVVNQSR